MNNPQPYTTCPVCGQDVPSWGDGIARAHRLCAAAYRVIVPRPKKRPVSYPAAGQPLYTRAQAADLLRRFNRPDGDPMEPWAEGPGERFTLFFPDDLRQEGRP